MDAYQLRLVGRPPSYLNVIHKEARMGIATEMLNEGDYDPGLLNDYGGGNVSWWMDYIRSEIGRANDHWRTIISNYAQSEDSDDKKCCHCNGFQELFGIHRPGCDYNKNG